MADLSREFRAAFLSASRRLGVGLPLMWLAFGNQVLVGCHNKDKGPTAQSTAAVDATAPAALPQATTPVGLAADTSAVGLPAEPTPGASGLLRRVVAPLLDGEAGAMTPWREGWLAAWCSQGQGQRGYMGAGGQLQVAVGPSGAGCQQRLAASQGTAWWLGTLADKPTLSWTASPDANTWQAVALPAGLTLTASAHLGTDGQGGAVWGATDAASGLGKAGAVDRTGKVRWQRDLEGKLLALAPVGNQEVLTATTLPGPRTGLIGLLTRWSAAGEPVWQRRIDLSRHQRPGVPFVAHATAGLRYSGQGAGVAILVEEDSSWGLLRIDSNGQFQPYLSMARKRTEARLEGMPDGSIVLLEGRTSGAWLQRVQWRGTKLDRSIRFGWSGDEQVLASAADDRGLGILSRDTDTGTAVITALQAARLSDVVPRAPPATAAACNDPEPCDIEVQAGDGTCGSWPLADGHACGPAMRCRGGYCRSR